MPLTNLAKYQGSLPHSTYGHEEMLVAGLHGQIEQKIQNIEVHLGSGLWYVDGHMKPSC